MRYQSGKRPDSSRAAARGDQRNACTSHSETARIGLTGSVLLFLLHNWSLALPRSRQLGPVRLGPALPPTRRDPVTALSSIPRSAAKSNQEPQESRKGDQKHSWLHGFQINPPFRNSFLVLGHRTDSPWRGDLLLRLPCLGYVFLLNSSLKLAHCPRSFAPISLPKKLN